jgi:hypothetical protein
LAGPSRWRNGPQQRSPERKILFLEINITVPI